MAQFIPIIYDSTSGEHRPAGSGEQIGVTHVPIDPSGENVIRQTVNGLMVSPADLPPALSSQAGNYLRYGNDKGLFCDGNDVLSNADDNVLRIDATDKKIKLTANDIKTAAAGSITIVSADANNAIRRGSDNGAYLNSDDIDVTVVSADASNVIRKGSDGGAYLSSSDVNVDISTRTDNLLTRDSANALLVSESTVASGVVSSAPGNLLATDYTGKLAVTPAGVAGGILSADSGNLLGTDATGRLTLTPSQLISSTANNAVVQGNDGKLYVPKVDAASIVDANDKVLTVNTVGTTSTLSTTMNLTYNQTTGLLSIIGKNGQTVATATVQASGSVLESAVIVVNPAGQPAGTYLALTFRLADGTLNTVYANLSALADVYTAGAGIDITNYVISAKVDANGGLTTTANGLAIDNSAVAPALADDLMSSDSGNMLQLGSDNLLYVPLDCGEL